jgi:hypothetical protein
MLRRTSAYNEFTKEKGTMNRDGNVAEAWRNLSAVEKHVYKEKAAITNIERKRRVSLGIADDLRGHHESIQCLSRSQLKGLRQHQLTNTLRRNCKDRAWGSGLGLGCASSPLAPEFVDTVAADAQIEDGIRKRFSMDRKILANPPQQSRPSFPYVCHLSNSGVCKSSVCSDASQV